MVIALKGIELNEFPNKVKQKYKKKKKVSLNQVLENDSLLSQMNVYTMYSRLKKKKERKKERNTPIYFNTNYNTKMKLVLIIMNYCLFRFDALKFFLGVRLHGGVST